MTAIRLLVEKMFHPALFKNRLEAQSTFLADISHELQTPLAILRGNIDILMKGDTQEPQNNLWVMKATVDRMAHSIEKLLAVGKLNFSKGTLNKTLIHVDALLEELCVDCEVLARHKHIKLVWESDRVAIKVDKERLREVLCNLVSNALKHTPAGGVISLTGRKRHAKAEIVVEDTGCGIAKEYLAHIFERFYRIDKNSVPGMGIGLHICRQIVEAHGGAITAESELGRGSRFIILLPLGIIN